MSTPGYRIVHVIPQLRFGAGRYVVDTAIEQHRRIPNCVAVIVSEAANGAWTSSPALVRELADQGIAVHTCGDFFQRGTSPLRDAAERLRQTIGSWRKDTVVHAHTAPAAVMARWAGAPRIVATCHGWGPDRPAAFDLQDAIAFSLCDAVTSPSRAWADIVRERTGVAHVGTLACGLDLCRYPHIERTAREDEPRRVVCIGELTARKGHDVLLEAMESVWQRLPNAELHVIGDGDAREAMRALAARVDPTGARVVFHGTVDAPYALLDRFDLFALASRSDNQPIATIEAMLAGLPVVGTRVGGIAELIEESRCGLVVPSETPSALAAALTVLLEATESGRRELGAAGERFARSRFDVRTQVTALDRLYRTPPSPASRPEPAPSPKAAAAATNAVPSAASSREPRTRRPRLHLGCGKDRRTGWVNVDTSWEVNPDIVADAHSLPMFDDDSVEAIEACHLLERLPLHETRMALREWFRILACGGELFLEMPDLRRCIELLGKHVDARGCDLGMTGIFGWPPDVEAGGIGKTHKWGWTPDSLGHELQSCGFVDVEVVPVTQTWRPATRLNRDFRIRAVKA
jgi:glycosyltransferase involved in cell wall biosynthesis